MQKLSFWTPVRDSNSFLRFGESYFDFGKTHAKILRFENDVAIVEQKTEERTWTKCMAIAFKIASFATVIIPAIALVAKVLYRAQTAFIIEVGEKRTDLIAARDRLQREKTSLSSDLSEALKKRNEAMLESAKHVAFSRNVERLEEIEQNQRKRIEDLEAELTSSKQKEENLLLQIEEKVNTLGNLLIRVDELEKKPAIVIDELQQLKVAEQKLIDEINELKLDKVALTLENMNQSTEIARLKQLEQKLLEIELSEFKLRFSESIEIERQKYLHSPLSSPKPIFGGESTEIIQTRPLTSEFEQRLDTYLKAYQPDVSLEEALEKIKAGKALHSRIVNEGETLKLEIKEKSKEERLYALSCLLWFFMAEAIDKKNNEGFYEGSYFLISNPKKVFEFLIAFPEAKERISSHLKGRGKPHYGIDVQSPGDKGTLLFALIDGGEKLFLKPENHGVESVQDLVNHAGGLVASKARKIAPGVFGSDQQTGYRKERIPTYLIEHFSVLVEGQTGRNALINDAKIYGISFMISVLKELNIKDEIFDNLDKKYDHLNHRTGEEVILSIFAGSDSAESFPPLS